MKTICPHCYFEYAEVDDMLAGKEVECANCNMKFVAENIQEKKQTCPRAVPAPPPPPIKKSRLARVCAIFGWFWIIIGLKIFVSLAVGAIFIPPSDAGGVVYGIIAVFVMIFGLGIPGLIASTVIKLLTEIAYNTRKQ